ncbi:MAG: hypothetical protein U0269_36735 [Polyangiales bacterium]
MLDPAVQPYYQRLTQNPDDAEALAVLWQWFGERGQLQQLAQIVEQVAERRLDPASAADLFFRAGQLWELNLRRPDRAAPNYRKAYERDPNNLAAIHAARELYLSASNFKNAATLFEKELAVTADPARRIELARGLADARSRLNDPTGQAAALEEVIRLQPEDYQSMHQLAEAYKARAQGPGGGIEDLMRASTLLTTIAHALGGEHLVPYCEAALDAWPGDESAFTTVRDHYIANNAFADFAAREIAFLSANPESPMIAQVRRDLASLYSSAGQFDDAIDALAPLAETDPAALRELADLYGSAGRIAERVAIVAQLPPSSDPAQRLHDLREMAAVYGQQGDRATMLSALREVLDIEPADPEALSIVDEELRASNDWAELRTMLYAAARAPGVTNDQRLAWLRDIATFSESKLGDPSGAVEAWRAVLTSSPDDPTASDALERLLEAQERWDDLARWLEKRAARESDPRARLDTYLRLADLHRDRRGDAAGESDALAAIWNDDPTDDAVAMRLVEARKRAGAMDLAADVLRVRAETAAPELVVARYTELAEHFVAMDAHDDALAAWQQVCVNDPEHAGAWEAIETLLERTGRHDLLLETLISHAEGPAAGTNPARLFARAAEIARLLGDVRTAITQSERALELEPSNESMAALLGDALEAAGEEERLLELLRSRVGRHPDGEPKIETLRRLGRALSRTDRDAAKESWDELRAVSKRIRGRDDVEALEALAGFAELEGDEERLAALLDEAQLAAIDEPSKRRDLLTRRAELLEQSLGRPDEALAALRLAAEQVEPESALAWSTLAAAAKRQNHPDLTAGALEKQASLTEDDEQRAAIAAQLAAVCEQELEDRPRTIRALELQYDADPTEYSVVERLLRLNEQEERWAEVLKHMTVLSEVEGDDDELAKMTLTMADIAESKLGDAAKAFEILSAAAKNGDEGALEAARAVSQRANLHKEFAALLDERAHKTTGARRCELLLELSQLSESTLRDRKRAIDAAFKAVVAQPTSDGALDRFDALARPARAVELATQAYAAALAGRDGGGTIREAALRGSKLLEAIGAPSQALDLVLGAQGRAASEDALLDEVERLAPLAGRGEELFIAFDRRRNNSKDERERFELILRAAKAALVGLNDLETANNYLRQALSQAANARSVDASKLARIVQVARQADEARPDANMRSTLVELLANVAKDNDEDEPKLAAMLQRFAGDICADDLALPDHAWMLYARSLELWPSDHETSKRIEALAEKAGRLPELVDKYEKVIDDAYEADTARFYQARRAALLGEKLGRVDDAIEALRQLVEIAPKDLNALHLLQDTLSQHGRYQDLLMALERELEVGTPDKASVNRSIARVWDQQLRNAFEAKDAWKRVLKLVPDDEEAKSALERLDKKKKATIDDDLGDGPAAPVAAPPPPRVQLARTPIVAAASEEIDEIDSSEISDSTSARILAPPPSTDDELAEEVPIHTGELMAPEPDELDPATGAIRAPAPESIADDEVGALSTGEYSIADANDPIEEPEELEPEEPAYEAQAEQPAEEALEAEALPMDAPAEPSSEDEATPAHSVDAMSALDALEAADEVESTSDYEAAPQEYEDNRDESTMAIDTQAFQESSDEDSLDSLAQMVAAPTRPSAPPTPPPSFKPPPFPPRKP